MKTLAAFTFAELTPEVTSVPLELNAAYSKQVPSRNHCLSCGCRISGLSTFPLTFSSLLLWTLLPETLILISQGIVK